MLKLFKPADRNFNSNGDLIIKPLKAKIKKEDNGDYYLELETDLSYVDHLKEGNIIVADMPQGYQAFRITNPHKTKSKITIKAWHIFYDSENYLILNSMPTDVSCNDALIQLNNATEPSSPFTVSSNIYSNNSLEIVRKSLYEAIIEACNTWSGHLVRNNFDIKVQFGIGRDIGVTVRYKKNLKDITCEEKWDDVVTKLLPVGKDELLLNALDETADIYVTSSKQYNIPYTKTVTFKQDLKESDYQDETAYKQALIDDLRNQAELYVEENSYPKVNYTLKANIETITDIGDIIQVIDERLGLDLMTSVISFTYDCISNKYIEVEFGNFKNNLSNLVSNITNGVNKDVKKSVQSSIDVLDARIPTHTSQLVNDSNFITDATNTLVNYYKKSEIYTKEEVDELISSIVNQ